ncbi:DUF951 domain-containing protein [Tepidiforma flava]|uniref:DUF951 domain-containing protein n=1 Tax=Tepidiforma flava TaxID=3004094 RepID=A0ABY7M7X2_9CHLR|nr:DUF951 domain-containing protein [Tepidiforma flava]WBL35733.1 DUF951 domain-containing protein [Tepidiforma flava]
MPAELREGDVVRLKRRHPCGGWDWQVYRVGADIGMQCVTCSRRVMLERGEFERRLKAVVRHDA